MKIGISSTGCSPQADFDKVYLKFDVETLISIYISTASKYLMIGTSNFVIYKLRSKLGGSLMDHITRGRGGLLREMAGLVASTKKTATPAKLPTSS